MSGEPSIDSGVVLGFGGTNARFGIIDDGDLRSFDTVNTPEQPREFFGWMARQVLHASEDGQAWLVAGFPGPVSADGKLVGPMANVPGLSKNQYSLIEELSAADTAAGRLMEDGFQLIAVNDGELAAQAAASRVGEHHYDKTAALILGTGVGTGVVIRDPNFQNVYRADRSNPLEIGHITLGADPTRTFESFVSGPALERDYGLSAQDLPVDHPAWKRVGETIGQMTTLLGVMNGVGLVVPCGGVGSGGSTKYEPHLRAVMDTYEAYSNGTQKLFMPKIAVVPIDDAQTFELYGGEGVVRDFNTREHTPSS